MSRTAKNIGLISVIVILLVIAFLLSGCVTTGLTKDQIANREERRAVWSDIGRTAVKTGGDILFGWLSMQAGVTASTQGFRK